MRIVYTPEKNKELHSIFSSKLDELRKEYEL